MPKPNRLVDLFHHRWTVPLLGELQRTAGAKMVALVHRLGVNRGALRQTLDAAIRRGWVMRNPGYGHPLRPEFILTKSGARIAGDCLELVKLMRSRKLERVILRKWSAAVLHAVAAGRSRFSELKAALPGISDRALALTLKQLHAAKLLRRHVRDAFPPATEYVSVAAARPLVQILGRL